MGLSLHISIVLVIMMVVSLQVWLPLGCFEEERIALLKLKDSLNYPNGTSLPSWRKDDARCCDWESVGCSSGTGRVTELYLEATRNGELGDWYLKASLFLPFQELIYLELADNQIAGWVENKGAYQPFKMSKLEHLDLIYNRLDNSILSYMDGLSSLKTLDISYNRLKGLIDLKECLSNLETLYLSGNNITKVVASGGPTNLSALYLNNITTYGSSLQTLLELLGAFPNLTTLGLRYNDLRGRVLGDDLRNLSSLEQLYLDRCSLDENFLQSLGALSSLKNLSLQALSGGVPFQAFLNLKNLELLDLSDNTLNSSNIFQTIGTMTSLKTLMLRNCSLNGQLPTSPGFINLKNLELLDLSESTLNSSNIFQTIGTMTSLKTLMLVSCSLNGQLPTSQDFINLKNLELLDLSYNTLNSSSIFQIIGTMTSLKTLTLSSCNLNAQLPTSPDFINLKNLELLDLSYNTLNSNNIFQIIGKMTSLKTLRLSSCNLNAQLPISPGFINLKNLELLDLSESTLNSSNIFQTIGTMTSLKTLMLASCSLNGQLPTSQGFLNLKNLELLDMSGSTLNSSNIFQTIITMTSLKTLMLSGCSLNGQLPTGLCDLNNLQELDISYNDLSGFLPPCLANLTSLQQLDLSSNHLKILMSLIPLYNLSKLESFDGRDNEIYAEEDDHNLSPKFQLESLYLSGHGQDAGAFPKLLYHQFNLQSLSLANIQIKGEFPSWLIENNTYLQGFYLENCSLSSPFLLPRSSHVNLSSLSISMNYFQGQIPAKIGAYFPGLQFLMMSDNDFNGSIPSSLGSISSLRLLDLSNNALMGRTHSNNSLQGQILGWIGNMPSLEFLDLSANNFSGPLPPRFRASSKLRNVYLSRNKLQGPIAMEFDDYYEIEALDLSHNNFTGRIPQWIGRLSNLRFLLLNHNNLDGEIPIQLCRLDQLALIDLSHNYLSGNILSCMLSFQPFPYLSSYEFDESLEFTTKNVSFLYKGSILEYFTGIDFSCNNFTGKIPLEIGNLSKIKVLNLSHNSLIGSIPPTFPNLKEIESLDLSYNKLEGEIPPQLTELYSLAFFQCGTQ